MTTNQARNVTQQVGIKCCASATLAGIMSPCQNRTSAFRPIKRDRTMRRSAGVDRNSLLDARAFTPFVGLVRHVRVARTEDERGDTAERLC
jgi:hypothetical protein